eukprot:SAG11_NODE_15430_length_578_cov_2.601253_1_plen_75_part_00
MLVRRRDGRRGCVTLYLPGGVPTGTGTRVPGYCVPEVHVDLIRRRPSLNTRGTLVYIYSLLPVVSRYPDTKFSS